MLNFSHSKVPVILVDDEQSELDAYGFLLESMGVNQVIKVNDSRALFNLVADIPACVLFLDLNMPHKSGKEVLAELKQALPHIPVIIITANSEIETAVDCLKLGAHDYLVKPINMNTFASALRNALEISSLRTEVLTLKGLSFTKTLKNPDHFKGIITQNPSMVALFQYIESISPSREPVLILGETGSGKELISRAVHDASGLTGPFVAVDVAGLDDTLFSDTLFGHRRGAYTGAEKERAGLIEQAESGTLFLDEIGDLAPASQVKLLRLLQQGIYYPLGSDRPQTCSARIIAATNKSRSTLSSVALEEFRTDLFYRLSTHLLQIPPLRERKEDIPLLTEFLKNQAATDMGKTITGISRELMDRLCNQAFPGNVRELKTYVYDAVARCTGQMLSLEDIRDRLPASRDMARDIGNSPPPSLETLMGGFPTLADLTQFAIDQALERSENNQAGAARLLGISKQALNKRLKNRSA